MGLFGVSSKPVDAGHHGFDWGSAAMGFFGVPASTLIARRQHNREEEAARQQQAQIDAVIDADQNLPTPEAKAYAKLNPKAYIDAYMTRFQTRQFGPEGGSVMQPGASGPSWTTAPRFDGDGNIFAPGSGKSVPTILQRGTKAVPVQPGGQVQVLDSISGRPVMTDGSVGGLTPPPQAPQAPQAPQPPSGAPRPGQVEDGYIFKGGDPADPKSWAPVQGGAVRSAPPTFP